MSKGKSAFGAVAGILTGMFMIFFGFLEMKDSLSLKKEGISVAGIALEGWSERRRRSLSKSYYFEVEFQAEGREEPVNDVIKVDKDYFDEVVAKDGDINIIYHPENLSNLQAGSEAKLQWGHLAFGFLMFGFGAFLALDLFKPSRTEDQLLTEAGIKPDAQPEALPEILLIEKHEYAPTDGAKFRGHDQAFYTESQSKLESLGFRHVVDLEDLTAKKMAGINTFFRILIGDDGATVAVLYHLKAGGLVKKSCANEEKVVDFGSVFSNGEFVTTSTAETIDFNLPTTIDAGYRDSDTPLEDVVTAHRQRVQEFQAKHPGAGPIGMDDRDDVIAMLNAMNRVKANFRKNPEITREELQKLTGVSEG